MVLYGNFDTMSIRELLRWIDAGKKSGTLEVERRKSVKRISLREGRVVGCSSNAPATLMGQFLLSCGAITEKTLGEGLRRHSDSKINLGQILLDMNAITREDLDRFVDAKVEETVYGLFDWPDADFRFHSAILPDENAVSVDLEVSEILRRGIQRANEAKRSREVIPDRGVVLVRRRELEPDEISTSRAAKRIFGLIDGKRTVAEILLHSHAPEFLVVGFLAALVDTDAAEVKEVRPEQSKPFATAVELEALQAVDSLFERIQNPAPSTADSLQQESIAPTGEDVEPDAARQSPPRPTGGPRELQNEINVALQLMASGKPAVALDLLNAMVATHPGDVALRRLLVNAENDFCRKLLTGEFPISGVPVREAEAPPGQLSSEESFLLEHIDGQTNIQLLLWIAPMRDADTLKALHHMARTGWIRISPGEPVAPERP
jgi:hypothetical protein